MDQMNTTMNYPLSALVMVAPNGARRTKADHLRIPLSIEETARVAAECFEAGAGAVHAHVRDAAGRHILDADLYRALIDAVRREAGPEMVLQVTTEAVGQYTPQEQMALVEDLKPEAVSIALREMMPDDNHEIIASRFYRACHERAIAVQHILYDLADVDRLMSLRSRGVLPDGTGAALVVLGRYADGATEMANLAPAIQRLRPGGNEDLSIMVCAFGQVETAALAASLAFDGHARVGFENSIQRPDGTPASDNSESVRRVVALADGLGRRRADRGAAMRVLGGR
jgi:3-keto-5-aminohexanoate cleavage enzyme